MGSCNPLVQLVHLENPARDGGVFCYPQLMTEILYLQKPFTRQSVYQGLARGVDHMRIGGGKPIVVVIQLGEHPTKDEVYFEHPYAFEALIRGLVINPICQTIEIQFLED